MGLILRSSTSKSSWTYLLVSFPLWSPIPGLFVSILADLLMFHAPVPSPLGVSAMPNSVSVPIPWSFSGVAQGG